MNDTLQAFTFLNENLALYLMFVFLGVAIFMVALLGTFKGKFRAVMMTVFFAFFLGTSYYSLGELLGRPKPVDVMTWDRPNVEEATVLAQFHKKGVGIYLLLMHKGLTVPKYYVFPWNDEMSKKLKRGQAAQQMKEIKGLKLKLPFQRTWEDRKFPEVYELPWPKEPEKDAPRIEQLNLDGIDA